MSILILSGARNVNGQTARAVKAFMAGVSAQGCAVSQVMLPTLTIERCRQCEDNGWGLCRRSGQCVIDDDFAGLVQRIRESRAVVLATPVYYGDLSESLRAFLDRLRRISTQEEGRLGIVAMPLIGICVAGGGGGGAVSCCRSLEKIVNTCGFDVVEMIPVRRQNLEAKLEQIRLSGQWFAGTPAST